VIQRLASLRRSRWNGVQIGACLSLLCLSLLACHGSLPDRIPRTVHGSTLRGAFVPPYAYEAYVRGELLLAEGRPAEASAQFELASTAPDEDPYLLSRLAYAQLRSGKRAEAERTLAHAGQLDRCSEAVWLVRGALAEQAGELDAARGALEKATRCAPHSPRGELALAELLSSHGQPAAALDILASAAQRPYGAPAERALEGSLTGADAATFVHALADLGAYRAASSEALEHAIRVSLQRGLPRLALRLREQHAARLPPALEAEVLIANGLLDELSVLIAASDAGALGGHERTAEIALQAHAYERAELEATSALSGRPTDAMHALRARAALALGRGRAAVPDLLAIREATLKRAVLVEALAALGSPALAQELGKTK
jgi:tetratricopeptide (TPR) repeat protein